MLAVYAVNEDVSNPYKWWTDSCGKADFPSLQQFALIRQQEVPILSVCHPYEQHMDPCNQSCSSILTSGHLSLRLAIQPDSKRYLYYMWYLYYMFLIHLSNIWVHVISGGHPSTWPLIVHLPGHSSSWLAVLLGKKFNIGPFSNFCAWFFHTCPACQIHGSLPICITSSGLDLSCGSQGEQKAEPVQFIFSYLSVDVDFVVV